MLGHRHSVTQVEEPRPRPRSNRKGSLALPGNTERNLLDFLDCEQTRLPSASVSVSVSTTNTLTSAPATIRPQTSSPEEHAVAVAPVSVTPPPVPARPPAVPKRNYVPPTFSTTDQLKHNVRKLPQPQPQPQLQSQTQTQTQPPPQLQSVVHPKLPMSVQKKHSSIPPSIPPPEAKHPPLRVPPRNQNSLDSATLCRNNTFAASQTKNQIRTQPIAESTKISHNKGQFSEKYVQRNNSQLPVAPMPVGMGQVFDFTATATTQHEFNVTTASRNKIPSASPPVNATTVVKNNYQNSKVASSQASNVPPPLTHIPNGQVHRSTSNSKISVRQDSSVSSDSFSQTSSPSYTTKTMETPLLPHHGVNTRSGCNGKITNKTNALILKNQQSIESGRDTNNTALTKSVSTPASLQTIVRFHNGSNMSLHHRVRK